MTGENWEAWELDDDIDTNGRGKKGCREGGVGARCWYRYRREQEREVPKGEA